MIRINLLPVKELKAEVARRRELLIGGISLGAVVVFLIGIYLFQLHQASILKQELATLRKDLEALDSKAKEVTELQSKVKEVQSKNKVIEDITKKKSGPVRVMESLSAAIPNALWLTEFKETGGNLSISGVAMDNQTIAEFLKMLANYPYFSNTELVETVQTEQTGLPPRKFLIKSQLSYQPRPAQALPASAKGNSG
jgi:type IV pilus assembly protein PilN